MKTNRALSLCDEANVLLKQKQFEPGLQKCREAMKIDTNSAQVRDNFAAYLNNYASDCVQQQDLKHAEELIKEAVSLESTPGVAAGTRLTSLKNYAALLKFQGRDAEAKDIEAKMKAAAQ
jgi:tetratricopeptide (TPR) repeat protein